MNMDTRGQPQIAAGMVLGMHLPVTSGLRLEVQQLLLYHIQTLMWIAHLPLACSLQDYHGGFHDNLAGRD